MPSLSEGEDTSLSEGEEPEVETVGETVEEEEEPTAPAPRRSSQVRSKGHHRPDFVYDFALTTPSMIK